MGSDGPSRPSLVASFELSNKSNKRNIKLAQSQKFLFTRKKNVNLKKNKFRTIEQPKVKFQQSKSQLIATRSCSSSELLIEVLKLLFSCFASSFCCSKNRVSPNLEFLFFSFRNRAIAINQTIQTRKRPKNN